MIIRLKRYSYGKFETEGRLHIGSSMFATIERPWVPNPNGAKGGAPHISCIPDGMYRVAPFERPNGDLAYMIFNPDLGVHRMPQDHDKDRGRNLVLIHKGNWALDVEGCVAPGIYRKAMSDKRSRFEMDQAVARSGEAMVRIIGLLGDKQHLLTISNECGASDHGNG